ncbi:hypothetical protein F2P45_33380 [Massilia sp. CCM 8733]|uniref:Tox-MPTase5 domain-containing protein n=2 Tax=Massilia mucilaginosa TaxID=2609282 RepID=A0ABX0P515_9BURK|nr:hypothetical protein [Massilia mucilaginosa]NHZ93855.1 hypothetical protein [Massilia mucilaginosa]
MNGIGRNGQYGPRITSTPTQRSDALNTLLAVPGFFQKELEFLGVTSMVPRGANSSAVVGGRAAAVEHAGGAQVYATGPQVYAPDLGHVTGKGAVVRNRAIDSIVKEDFPNLNLTYTPEYNPFLRTGIAQEGAGTQIGKTNFSSRDSLRDVIVHEELHHRWWERGIYDHHPVGSVKETRFYDTIDRYKRMRGWNE